MTDKEYKGTLKNCFKALDTAMKELDKAREALSAKERLQRQAVLDLIPIPPREQWIKRDNRLNWIRATREMIEELPFIEQTQMVDKSNFSMEQYKADLETAHDCGEAKWLKYIEDIKAEIEKQIERDHIYAIGETAVVKAHDGIVNGLQVAIRIIDRNVNELRGNPNE